MFKPKRFIFEKGSLDYKMGNDIYDMVKNNKDAEIIKINSNRIKEHIPGDDLYSQYSEGKKTLVIGIKKSLKFQSCKPSAHYQLPLVSGCMGQCEYCYLNTKLGDKPFVKAHVNIDEILDRADKYIEERGSDITIFEGSATSDPVAVEGYTHSLAKSIIHFADIKNARFRFVTKYNDVDSFVDLDHKDHTEIRFSINTDYVINNYEHFTASRDKRIEAAIKMQNAGYKVGFLIAPVFIYDNWKSDYKDLLLSLKSKMSLDIKHPITFEIISHRYTTVAKNRILQVFKDTTLPMNEEGRQFKYGQFGYGKYIYPKDTMNEIKSFFIEEIERIFNNKKILYII